MSLEKLKATVEEEKNTADKTKVMQETLEMQNKQIIKMQSQDNKKTEQLEKEVKEQAQQLERYRLQLAIEATKKQLNEQFEEEKKKIIASIKEKNNFIEKQKKTIEEQERKIKELESSNQKWQHEYNSLWDTMKHTLYFIFFGLLVIWVYLKFVR